MAAAAAMALSVDDRLRAFVDKASDLDEGLGLLEQEHSPEVGQLMLRWAIVELAGASSRSAPGIKKRDERIGQIALKVLSQGANLNQEIDLIKACVLQTVQEEGIAPPEEFSPIYLAASGAVMKEQTENGLVYPDDDEEHPEVEEAFFAGFSTREYYLKMFHLAVAGGIVVTEEGDLSDEAKGFKDLVQSLMSFPGFAFVQASKHPISERLSTMFKDSDTPPASEATV